METQVGRRGRKRTGCLIVKNGRYYLRVVVNGNPITRSLGTGDQREAESRRPDVLAELGVTARDSAEILRNVQDKLESAEVKARRLEAEREAERAQREREARRLPLKETWRAYLQSDTKPDTGPEAEKQYEYVWEQFTGWLAGEKIKHLSDLTPDTMKAYVRYLKARPLASKSVKNHVAVIRLVFKHLPPTECLPAGLFDWFTAKSITVVESHRQEIPLGKLAEICEKAEGELKLLFFLGIYTGLRLKDCALLPWDEVDLQRGIITHSPFKLRRRMDEVLKIPVHADLLPMLEAIPPAARKGYVLPDTAAQYQRRANTLTDHIQEHFTKCGLQVYHETKNGQRPAIRFGFHSLRHSAVTLWQRAGAPQSAVMELVGHHSRAMTMKYTHHDLGTLRDTVNRIPSLSRPALPSPDDKDRQELADLAQNRTVPVAAVRQALAILRAALPKVTN